MTIAKFYGQYPLKALAGVVNYTGDVVKCALLYATYTPNQDTHVFFSDVSTSQVGGSGYTAGGVTLTGKSVYYSTSTNDIALLCDNISFPGLTVSPALRYAVIYHDTGNPATSVLMQYQDLETSTTPTAQDLVLNPASGILGSFTVA
jgi:hypothetical protein